MNVVQNVSIGMWARNARLAMLCKTFALPQQKGVVFYGRWLLQIGLFMTLSRAGGANAEPFSRFGFCVAPVPPGCVHAAIRKNKQREECARLTESYVSLVFGYRNCLSAEMERAVREANEALKILKCPDRKGPCFTPSIMDPTVDAARSFPPGEKKFGCCPK
jgi:hypothetical protein